MHGQECFFSPFSCLLAGSSCLPRGAGTIGGGGGGEGVFSRAERRKSSQGDGGGGSRAERQKGSRGDGGAGRLVLVVLLVVFCPFPESGNHFSRDVQESSLNVRLPSGFPGLQREGLLACGVAFQSVRWGSLYASSNPLCLHVL